LAVIIYFQSRISDQQYFTSGIAAGSGVYERFIASNSTLGFEK
jgi:hypothetical protein